MNDIHGLLTVEEYDKIASDLARISRQLRAMDREYINEGTDKDHGKMADKLHVLQNSQSELEMRRNKLNLKEQKKKKKKHKDEKKKESSHHEKRESRRRRKDSQGEEGGESCSLPVGTEKAGGGGEGTSSSSSAASSGVTSPTEIPERVVATGSSPENHQQQAKGVSFSACGDEKKAGGGGSHHNTTCRGGSTGREEGKSAAHASGEQVVADSSGKTSTLQSVKARQSSDNSCGQVNAQEEAAAAAVQPPPTSSSSGSSQQQPHSILRRSSCQLPLSESPSSSPCHTQSQLFRNKSLKRVSFDDKQELIRSSDQHAKHSLPADIPEDKDTEADEDLPPLEEVKPQFSQERRSSRLRSPSPPLNRMANIDEQIEVPNAEGEQVPKKEKKPHIKGITFREFDHVKDFEDLVRTVVTMCDQEEQERLREMEDWIVKNEGTWVLAEGFNSFLGRLFHDPNLPSDARVAMLRLLAYGAGQDDIVLILHMDRKDHLLMNYAQKFDRLPIKEQEALALLFCNLFETGSASEWLLYISEWDAPGGGLPLSNIRVTTKVAVNALLGDTPSLVDYGTALMNNLATKEVFDDVCSELAMAILQFFQGKPPEEQVFRCMKALLKFCTIGGRDVPQLVKMIGPDPAKFKGTSSRVDEVLEPLSAKLASVPSF